MSLSEDGKAEKKLKAIRRAQFRLGQRLDAIDWEFDVLAPEVRNLKAGKSVLGLEAGAVFDIRIKHEPVTASESSESGSE